VETVALINGLPIRDLGSNVGLWDPENPPPTMTATRMAHLRNVFPGYFEAMGIPLLAGRDFHSSDGDSTIPVMILNQSAADSILPGVDPLGRVVAVDLGVDEPGLFEVVGIVGDHHITSLGGQVRLAMFRSYHQQAFPGMQLAIRTRGPARRQLRAVQDAVLALDPTIPLRNVGTMEEEVSASVSGLRSLATLLGTFSFAALFLAALGLYGVLAYYVSKRTQEIGVRVALGASEGSVLKMVLKKGLVLVGAGTALGVLGSVGANRLLDEFLFETPPADPLTMLVVGGLFLTVALAASLIPAWRAAKVDPAAAFRAE
jgi:predicted permease